MYLKYIFLGLLQGLTEFLPVSSSGHLVLFQSLLGMEAQGGFLLEILLHIGTLIAVFICFWQDIAAIFRQLISFFVRLAKKEPIRHAEGRIIVLIAISLLPLFAMIPLRDALEEIKKYPLLVGVALLITGVFLTVSDSLPIGKKGEKTATFWDSLAVGAAQAVALIPGISRSGATITAGLLRGFDRKFAVKFSFLMSIPAILGSLILVLKDFLEAGGSAEQLQLFPAIAGMAAAAVTGYFAIRLVEALISKEKFSWFSYYCFAAGLTTVLLSIFH